MKILTCLFGLASIGLIEGAPFQNLGFEEANTNGLSLGAVGPIAQLLPGWQLFRGNEAFTSIGYDAFEVPRESINDDHVFPRPLEGQFSLQLYPDHTLNYFLVQRGTVPADARTLSLTYSGWPWVASINGEDVTPQNRPITFGPFSVSGDVSKFAGQTVDLVLRTSFSSIPTVGDAYELDAIRFSVPEPCTALMGLAGTALVLAARLLKRRGSSNANCTFQSELSPKLVTVFEAHEHTHKL